MKPKPDTRRVKDFVTGWLAGVGSVAIMYLMAKDLNTTGQAEVALLPLVCAVLIWWINKPVKMKEPAESGV